MRKQAFLRQAIPEFPLLDDPAISYSHDPIGLFDARSLSDLGNQEARGK
ncbi:MAG: hypothetical protein ACRERS_01410 [Methylococcales bacterium]